MTHPQVQYKKQFDTSNGNEQFEGVDLHTAEELAAWVLNNTPQFGGLTEENLEDVKRLFPNTITYRGCYSPDYKSPEYVEYRRQLSWECAKNTIISNWESWAWEATKLNNILTAVIPEPIREVLIDRFHKGERTEAKDFGPYPQTLKGGIKIQAYILASFQHAWSNETIFAYIDQNSVVQTYSDSHSIGD